MVPCAVRRHSVRRWRVSGTALRINIPGSHRSALPLLVLFLTLGCQSSNSLPSIDVKDGRCTRRADTPEVALLPCTLSVLTYNVHGISPLLIHMETEGDERFRSASLGWLARDYDLVLLQEDFEYHDRIVEGPEIAFVQRGTGPRWTMWPLKILTLPLYPFRFTAPYGSGLTMAAPALQPVRVKKDGQIKRTDGVIVKAPLKECNGWISDANDCFSTKGILGMRLLLRNGTEIDVYTTHLDAGDSPGDRKTRRKQLKRIAKKIAKKSDGRAVILAGDLNIEYDPAPRNPPVPDPPDSNGDPPNPDYQILYDELLEPLGLRDTGARQRGKYFGHRVDWVLYRSGSTVDVQVLKTGEDERFRHPVNRGREDKSEDHRGVLSDHPALGVCFVIRRTGAGTTQLVIDKRIPRADSLEALHLCRRDTARRAG